MRKPTSPLKKRAHEEGCNKQKRKKVGVVCSGLLTQGVLNERSMNKPGTGGMPKRRVFPLSDEVKREARETSVRNQEVNAKRKLPIKGFGQGPMQNGGGFDTFKKA